MTESNIYDVVSALVWPVTIIVIGLYYSKILSKLVNTFAHKFENAYKIKVGGLELKGPKADPNSDKFLDPSNNVPIDGNDYSQHPAVSSDRTFRANIYQETRFLMLAHRIRPSKKEGQEFDISIFLVRKTSNNSNPARFQDVDRVEYYLGGYFGRSPNGSKFVVQNPTNGFAMTTSAYGPTLCVATIVFQDGKTAIASRFLDFEMQSVFETSGKDFVY